MENKNNKGIIACLIVIIVILLVLVVLFATGVLSFNTKDNKQTNSNTSNEVQSNATNDSNVPVNEKIDYTKYVGTYVNEGKTKEEDVRTTGGVILKITSITETNISFEVYCISQSTKIAAVNMNNVKDLKVNNGTYSFSWTDDSWGNSGTGTITITGNDIKLTMTTQKYNDDANWSMGEFDHLMHKVS